MKKLLVICGPTATGKTALALDLAKRLDGELVSADSRQVYRGMDIGTGKDLPKNEKKVVASLSARFHNTDYLLVSYDHSGVPVWMYDVVDPDEQFSVSHYLTLAGYILSDIWSRGKFPIVVGGTGLYIDALLATPDTIDIAPDLDLRSRLSTLTVSQLQEYLRKVNSSVYGGLNNSDRNNPRRLVRKIEIAESGEAKRKTPSQKNDTDFYIIGLKAPMDTIRKKIDTRVENRLQMGIVSEIKALLAKGYSWDLPSMHSLGYIQWRSYIESSIQKEDVLARWKHDELAYAKRQMTWFQKNKHIFWSDVTDSTYPEDVTRGILAWYTETNDEHKI
jgi:tRNA dimethylallyltransferase